MLDDRDIAIFAVAGVLPFLAAKSDDIGVVGSRDDLETATWVALLVEPVWLVARFIGRLRGIGRMGDRNYSSGVAIKAADGHANDPVAFLLIVLKRISSGYRTCQQDRCYEKRNRPPSRPVPDLES